MGSTVGPSVMQSSQPSTSSGVGYGGSKGAYQPNYYNLYSNYMTQPIPQARNPYYAPMNYSLQMPTRSPGIDSVSTSYSIPYGPSISQQQGFNLAKVVTTNRLINALKAKAQGQDPNLAAINQAFAPQKRQYDTEGNYFSTPVYMDQSKRDAILANPGAYLEYAKYVQGGGDPTKFAHTPQPISMMTAAQRDAYTKSQRNELSRLLPPAPPSDNSGG